VTSLPSRTAAWNCRYSAALDFDAHVVVAGDVRPLVRPAAVSTGCRADGADQLVLGRELTQQREQVALLRRYSGARPPRMTMAANSWPPRL